MAAVLTVRVGTFRLWACCGLSVNASQTASRMIAAIGMSMGLTLSNFIRIFPSRLFDSFGGYPKK
jgi:hypothetical protein